MSESPRRLMQSEYDKCCCEGTSFKMVLPSVSVLPAANGDVLELPGKRTDLFVNAACGVTTLPTKRKYSAIASLLSLPHSSDDDEDDFNDIRHGAEENKHPNDDKENEEEKIETFPENNCNTTMKSSLHNDNSSKLALETVRFKYQNALKISQPNFPLMHETEDASPYLSTVKESLRYTQSFHPCSFDEDLDTVFSQLNPSDLDFFSGIDQDSYELLDPIPLDNSIEFTLQNGGWHSRLQQSHVFVILRPFLPLPESLKPIVSLLLQMESSTQNESIVRRACCIVVDSMRSLQPGLNDRIVSGAIFERLVGSLGVSMDLAKLFSASANSGVSDDPQVANVFFRDSYPEVATYIATWNNPPRFIPTILQLALAYGVYHASKASEQGLEDFVKCASNELESMSELEMELLWLAAAGHLSSEKAKDLLPEFKHL